MQSHGSGSYNSPRKLVVFLIGGDKSTQHKDIELAHQYWADYSRRTKNGDLPTAILSAIRSVAEARGFKSFAASADLNRENLYRVLSEGGNPRSDTFFKILDALDLKLSVGPKRRDDQ